MKKYNNIFNLLLLFGQDGEFKKFLESHSFKDFLDDNEKFFLEFKKNKDHDNRKIDVPDWMKEKRLSLRKIIENNDGVLGITAPTSFGKTHTIIDVILDKKLRALIISPTLSLCTEYFMNIVHSNKFSTTGENVSMTPILEADIFILTPEKAQTLFEITNDSFDIIVFDEFYEAFSGDRSHVFYNVYEISLKRCSNIVLVLPKQTQLPEKIKFDDNFETIKSLTMRKFTKYVYSKIRGKTFKYLSTDFDQSKRGVLTEVIKGKVDSITTIVKWVKDGFLRSNNLIVIDTKKNMYVNTQKLIEKGIEFSCKGKIVNRLIDYYEKIAPNSKMLEGLKVGIAYHNGSVDKFARTLIEAAFKKGEIKILFANSTITKGVNLNPSILLINSYSFLNQVKKDIREVEIANTIGRTGRTILAKNHIGRVVIFTKENSTYENIEFGAKRVNDAKNIIRDEPLKIPDNITSVETAYKNYIANESFDINLSDSDTKILSDWLGGVSVEDRNLIPKKLINLVNRKFLIKYSSLGLENFYTSLFTSFLYKEGYQKNFIRSRSDAISKNMFINWNGSLSNAKNKNNGKFKPNTYHEDLLLSAKVTEYERTAGFFFSQLVSILIKKAIANKKIKEEILTKFLKRQGEEDSIATQERWPISFVAPYSANLLTKDILKELLDEIK